MAKILFYDLETTGVLVHKHSIHQISGIIEIDGEEVETFNFKVCPHPKALIDPIALQVGGVTEEQIKAYPDMKEVHTQLLKILGKHVDKYNKKDKMFLCGFNNASFDNNFFRAWFLQNGDEYFGSWFWANPLDVYVLATQFYLKQRVQMEEFKLRTVARRIGLDVQDDKLHDALYDVRLTKDIYHLIQIM